MLNELNLIFKNFRVEPATTSANSTVVTMATLKKVREINYFNEINVC